MSTLSTNSSQPETAVFVKTAYIPVLVMGLCLNTLAICMFLQRRASWKDTHVYMFNLATANCVLLLFLPFRIYDTFHPILNLQLCSFLFYIHYVNMYCSIFTRVAISVHRCVAISFPFATKARGPQKAVSVAVCALIWMAVIIICVVFYQLQTTEINKTPKEKMCYENPLQKPKFAYTVFIEILGFVLPLFIITVCTAQILRKLVKCHDEPQKTKTEIIGVIAVNFVVFVICYTPIHVGLYLKYTGSLQFELIRNYVQVFEWLATSNCCWDSVGFLFLLKTFYIDCMRKISEKNRSSSVPRCC